MLGASAIHWESGLAVRKVENPPQLYVGFASISSKSIPVILNSRSIFTLCKDYVSLLNEIETVRFQMKLLYVVMLHFTQEILKENCNRAKI